MFGRRSNVNFPMLLRVIGWLMMIEGIFMLFPMITCLLYGESDYVAFAVSSAFTVVSGASMTFFIRPRRTEMAKREGFLLTALVWVIFSLFGMIPFMLSSTPMAVSDAFFEAMSGFTTTGATVMTSIEHLSHGLLLWRCLMQWLGGMGIILFTLAVIPMLNHSGGMQMFNAEVTGITHDKIRPRISQTAKSLWMVYIVLSVLLFFLLWIGPMDVFDSVCHALSSMSTGGFSTRDNSIAGWNSVYIDIVIMVFMFLGGVNFALLYKASRGDFKGLWRNDTFKLYVKIVAVMYVIFVVAIYLNGQANSWMDLTVKPLFQIISTITSTGYTVTNFENWGTFILSLVFVLMFFGACAGSTSGGAKVDRLLYLLKNTGNELYRCIHPNAILSVKVNGKIVAPDTVSKVIAFLCLYVIIIMVGGIVLTTFGIPLVDSFFSAFSCISNVGLGAGVTGYGGSYDIVPDAAKWILSFLMLVGRLELFTVLILFTRGFWHK